MKDSLLTSLYARELKAPRHSHRALYGSRSLIASLDIVNELDGHSGCVNALSWSRSGNLLASGSDDQHLNIHTYQPQDSDEAFKLTTTVATGHTANIFSVKFMPHQNDRTVVTVAGDREVRVFDLEYAGAAREPSRASSYAGNGRRRGRDGIYTGVRYMNDGDTDCRVYRSHGDRVKRIVTESSPHLFLTCSEDGEVRQWDLRQPSSAYPSPRGREASGVPPPLISYKKYNLDLNTISCSPSQPHYIALGGSHLHCFLHDRRMTGRDRLQESGKTVNPWLSDDAEEIMTQATQCVRKFAPQGQQTMRRTENGHITACKISDARPDEMVVSWSGDHIYSFDLVRSPDASERTSQSMKGLLASETKHRVQESRDRKRKRKVNTSDISLGQQEAAARGSSKPRASDDATALRVRYRNGQSEDIPITRPMASTSPPLTEKQIAAQSIAGCSLRIRSSIFSACPEGREPTDRFTAALVMSSSLLPDIDGAMRSWTYPIDPSPETVYAQQTLRKGRESTRRFAQAAGTLSRVLGGKLRTASGPSELLANFVEIESRSTDLPLETGEQFGYDFIKAILLFLESGIGKLIEGFIRPRSMSVDTRAARRLPIPEEEAGVHSIDEILVPYLLDLASERPVVDAETNRFETDERRQIFPSERAALLAFAQMVRIPFADLSAGVERDGQSQDRETARKFWAGKVARGVLLNATRSLEYARVDGAFGGIGKLPEEVREIEERLTGLVAMYSEAEGAEHVEEETRDDEMTADDIGLFDVGPEGVGALVWGPNRAERLATESSDEETPALLEEDAEMHDVNDDDDEDDEDEDGDDRDLEDESSDPSEIDGVPSALPAGLPRFIFSSAFERRRHKERVEAHVPCSGSTRTYRGHCNVRTVKDVNYLGPDDEYVASGSDDGNLFIWDRKSGELVNILEGDGEVVNVVQSHPYETCLAVSGIDHTIKVFSPDSRARAKARLGDGVSAHDASQFSSIAFPRRLGRWRRSRGASVTSEPAVARRSTTTMNGEEEAEEEREEEEYVAPTGLYSRQRMQDAYQIMGRNDVDRQGGGEGGGGGGGGFITLPHARLLQLLFGGMGGGG